MRRILLIFLIVSIFEYSNADAAKFQNDEAVNEEIIENGEGKLTDFMDPFYGFLGFRTKRNAQHQEPQPRNTDEQNGRLRVQLKFDEKTKKIIIQDARIETNNRAKRYAHPHETGSDHTHSEHSVHSTHTEHHESHSSDEESTHTRAKKEADPTPHQTGTAHDHGDHTDCGCSHNHDRVDDRSRPTPARNTPKADPISANRIRNKRADDDVLQILNVTEIETTNKTKKPDSSSSSSSSEEKKIVQRPKRFASPGRGGGSNSQSNSQKRRQENRQQERAGAHGHDAQKKEEKKESSEEKSTTTTDGPSTTTTTIRRYYRLKRSTDEDEDEDDHNDEEINVLATEGDHPDDDNEHDRRKRAGVIQASFSRSEVAGETESYATEQNTRQHVRRNQQQVN